MKATGIKRAPNDPMVSGNCRKQPDPKPPACNPAGTICVYHDYGNDPVAAANASASVDVAIVFVSCESSEGADRNSLNFEGISDDLVGAVADSGVKATIVAAVSPAAVLMPWHARVAAITLGFFPGQEYGNALADVLFGDVDPTAKLPLTIPNIDNEMQFTEDMWPGVGDPKVATYTEGLNVGYRWYNAHYVAPAFPFGHGLTYTSFVLSSITSSHDAVTVSVTNTGKRNGTAVPQLYLTFPLDADEPPKQLKGYSRVTLKPDEAATVIFPLNNRSRSIWDTGIHAWKEAPGAFGVYVGFSSQDADALTDGFVNAI
jgi:beta-glucosidase